MSLSTRYLICFAAMAVFISNALAQPIHALQEDDQPPQFVFENGVSENYGNIDLIHANEINGVTDQPLSGFIDVFIKFIGFIISLFFP